MQRLVVLAYDDDCGLMAWEGSEELILRAFKAQGADEAYWIYRLEAIVRQQHQ